MATYFNSQLRINGKDINAQYLLQEGKLYLQLCQWNNIFSLLFSKEGTAQSLKETYNYVLPVKQTPYFWVSGKKQNLASDNPGGYIVSGTGWENTVYKYFHWLFTYRHCDVTPAQIKKLVKLAMKPRSETNPLTLLEWQWREEFNEITKKSRWEPHRWGDKCFKVHEPRSYQAVLMSFIKADMRAIEVCGPPPPIEVLREKVLSLL